MEASIIIPVLNEGERLRRCVSAIAAQRCHGPFEILVVDGGSTDGTQATLQGLPAVVLEAPGSSAGQARNVGAAEAKGRVLAFTDGDCIPQPGWLARLLRAFDETRITDLAGVGGGLRHLRVGPLGLAEDLETQAFYRGVITSNVAYLPEPFHEVGGFEPGLTCAEDWDLAWRLQEAGYRISHCPEAVVVHDPCENGSRAAFFRKQVWYARNDVPALLRQAFGAQPFSGTGRGRREARGFLRTAGFHAVAAALVASVVLAPAGVVLAGTWGLARTCGMAARVPEARRHWARMLGHETLKVLARGWGTWRGLADLIRELPPRDPWPLRDTASPALTARSIEAAAIATAAVVAASPSDGPAPGPPPPAEAEHPFPPAR